LSFIPPRGLQILPTADHYCVRYFVAPWNKVLRNAAMLTGKIIIKNVLRQNQLAEHMGVRCR
jgi:hypothetical protein